MRSNRRRVEKLSKMLPVSNVATDKEYKLFLSNLFMGKVLNMNYGIVQRMKQSELFIKLDSKLHFFDSKN